MSRLINYWSPDEDAVIREFYGTMSAGNIGERIGRTKSAVRNRAIRLGLAEASEVQMPWPPDEVAYLRANYGKMSARQIGDVVGRTKNSVIGQANRLGLNRSKKPAIQPWSEIRVREVALGSYRQAGCQWIDGDPLRGDHTYCGKPLKDGSRFSYCAEHHRIVFRKAIPQGERQHFKFRAGK